ncbi:AP-3 complex subunit delta isoform X2 [Atheta coriaria]|uniref:AP-3 complex subunit delta isoform X2 n=1 Tax=Dalotia coriaria TaxID=877792 RepID=UPI0031F45EFA
MALKKVKGNIERMFDKNLTDLVRGIRNNKENEVKYISQCMEDIKQELRQDNLAVKSNAIAKLTYLQMLGYDISWAGFNIIEVMSSNKFTLKRIGYLAASQSFHCDSELLMLTTNMIRKELNSQNQFDAGLALTSLSCFISTDLARDLSQDILTLLSSTKPYIRKKAVLMMYKVFLKYPEALRPAFPKLKEKLEDPDPGVQSAAVNVVCELARKNPKNYLSLAPVFFKLMTTKTNNWMLIKIIKLFGALTPLEPRLGKKLIEPLTNLIHSTSAMSLLYECINTVIAVLISISSGMPNHAASIQLCVQKLRILIEDSDQNLKYLGLLAMSKILKTHPKSVQAHKDLILQCLEDKDESIRLRALDLLYGMVSKKNLMEIVKKLMLHMEKAEGTLYRDELLSKIIQICAQNNYHFITNFEWYVTVLVELAQMEFGSKQGHIIADQLIDVCVRVTAIRPFAVNEMSQVLDVYASSTQFTIMQDVLYASAWLCGEFVTELQKPESTLISMLKYKNLPQKIEIVFLQNILKLYARCLMLYEIAEDYDKIDGMYEVTQKKLRNSLKSPEIEVQERASTTLMMLEIVQEEIMKRKEQKGNLIDEHEDESDETKPTTKIDEEHTVAASLMVLFAGELNPVAPKAQKKVPVPEGLDLDDLIEEPSLDESSSSDSEYEQMGNLFYKSEQKPDRERYQPELTEEERVKIREARKHEQANNPHYLKGAAKRDNDNGSDNYQVEDIPIAELALPVQLKVLSKRSDKYLNLESGKSKKKKSKSKGKEKRKEKKVESSTDGEDDAPNVIVSQNIEIPEGATLSDSESSHDNMDDPHRALNIDLDLPSFEESLVGHPKLTDKDEKKKTKKHDKHDKKRIKDKKSAKKSPPQAEDLIINDLLLVDEVEQNQQDDSSHVKVQDEILVGDNEVQEKKKKKHSKKDKDEKEKRKHRHAGDGTADAGKDKSKKKTKKSKRKEGDKENTKSHSKNVGKLKMEFDTLVKTDDDYEEAHGISTPSKEFR